MKINSIRFRHFSSDMVVRSIGNALLVILPELIGKKITNWFDLVRPLIAFKFQTVSETKVFGPIRIGTNLHDFHLPLRMHDRP